MSALLAPSNLCHNLHKGNACTHPFNFIYIHLYFNKYYNNTTIKNYNKKVFTMYMNVLTINVYNNTKTI